MALSKLERTAICKPDLWRSSQKHVVARQIQRIVLCGLAIALVPCGISFAQPSPDRGWPDGGSIGTGPVERDPTNRHDSGSHDPDWGDPRFDGRYVNRKHSPTVTLHELAHHVPGRAIKEYERALKARDKGDNENAVMYFKKSLELDSEFCAAINDLGTTYLKLDRIDLAAEQFNKALSVDHSASAPYSNLAVAYLRQSRFEDAERVARRAVHVGHGSTHGLLVLGMSLVMKGQFTAEAERSLKCAAGDYAVANYWLAVGRIQRGDIAAAKDELKAFLPYGDKPAVNIASELLQQLESADAGK